MNQQLGGIACRRLFTPRHVLDNVLILFEDTRISMMGDFSSAWLGPEIYNARSEDLFVASGLIDVHIHGCGGADFLDKTESSVRTICETAARGGASSIVATTTIPVDDEQLEGFAEFLRLFRSAPATGARLLGVHLEGPFLNPEKRGGFGMRFIQPIDLHKIEKILEMCADVLVKVTIAPELPHADSYIEMLTALPSPVEISLGHSTVTFENARHLFKHKRIRQLTHAFNAMNPFHHRDPGLIGAALLDDEVLCEVIPDGYHVTGPGIELLYRLKGASKLIAITDATGATATEPGTRVVSVGGVTMVADGAVRLENGALAGSNMLMADVLRSLQDLASIPIEDALEMCTRVPARSVHWDDRTGTPEPGKLADFCVLRRDGSVAATIRDGMLVHQATQVAAAV